MNKSDNFKYIVTSTKTDTFEKYFFNFRDFGMYFRDFGMYTCGLTVLPYFSLMKIFQVIYRKNLNTLFFGIISILILDLTYIKIVLILFHVSNPKDITEYSYTPWGKLYLHPKIRIVFVIYLQPWGGIWSPKYTHMKTNIHQYAKFH